MAPVKDARYLHCLIPLVSFATEKEKKTNNKKEFQLRFYLFFLFFSTIPEHEAFLVLEENGPIPW